MLKPLTAVKKATKFQEIGFRLPSGGTGVLGINIQPQPEFFAQGSAAAHRRWLICFRDLTLEQRLYAKYKAELNEKEAVIEDLKIAKSDLSKYSKELEVKVEERTALLSESNLMLKAILDSLGQGILVFNSQGQCLPVYSRVCESLLEKSPAGRAVQEVLGLNPKEASDFKMLRELIFNRKLAFEEFDRLGPSFYKHSGGREVALSYQPMLNQSGDFQFVILVATDKTEEIKAVRKAERERELVDKILLVTKSREKFLEVVNEARRILTEIVEKAGLSSRELQDRFHYIQGIAAFVALKSISKRCKELEAELRRENFASNSMRQWSQQKCQELKVELDGEVQQLNELLGVNL